MQICQNAKDIVADLMFRLCSNPVNAAMARAGAGGVAQTPNVEKEFMFVVRT
jgi:hypothetical protein